MKKKIVAKESQLNKAYKAIISRLEKTEKFVIEQAPEVCKQMIKEQEIESKTALIQSSFAGFFMLLSFAFFWYKGYTCGDGWWAAFTFNALSLAIPFGIGTEAIKELYQLKVCPKLFLLREFKNLIR